MNFLRIARYLIPLSSRKKRQLKLFSRFLSDFNLKKVKKLMKLNFVGTFMTSLNTQFKLGSFPQLSPIVTDIEIKKIIDDVNRKVLYSAEKNAYKRFSEQASIEIPKFLERNLKGYKDIIKAASLLLFCKDTVHLLIIGDPGTGKTEVLRAVEEISPNSQFGLGSGVSGVGLTGTTKGKEFIPGLLPRADKGICCIDELNLMLKKDHASLLNAMEKGFIAYNKGKTHKRINARIRVLATANPKGDRFVGKGAKITKTQLPFNEALLSRFHLMFIVRKPSLKEFKEITKHIVSKKHRYGVEDISFLKEYVDYAGVLKVAFPESLKNKVVDFIQELKEQEDNILREVSPRLVKAIIRLAKASARLELRPKVEEKDVVFVLNIIRDAYLIRK
jgi:DNA replicative helicase MCM subunit Mcm2 (Cdc46/Mcm family)